MPQQSGEQLHPVISSVTKADRLLRAIFSVTDADFLRPLHRCAGVLAGSVCPGCGRIVMRPVWGRAPGQPRLDAESERLYVLEQQT